MKRPALQELLGQIEYFNMVLFTKLDRLSRNVLDANNINKILKDNNVSMKATDESDIDTSNSEGMFLFNLHVSLAQREIEKTGERIKSAFEYKRVKKEMIGKCKYGYDIIDKKYVINENEQQNLINFYKYFVSVGGNSDLAYGYFREHFKSCNSWQTYKRYLKDTGYIGLYKTKCGDVIEDYIPPLMDEELFYEVQNLRKKRPKRCKSNDADKPITLFDGLIYCDTCNTRYSRDVHRYGKDNKWFICYGCWKANYHTASLCSNKRRIAESKIEKQLLNVLDKELEKRILETENMRLKEKPKENIKSKIKLLENKIEKLKELYLDNLINKDTYKKDFNKFSKEIEDLKLHQYEKTAKTDVEKLKQLLNVDIVANYEQLEKIEKRQFWFSILDKIYMKDGLITSLKFI